MGINSKIYLQHNTFICYYKSHKTILLNILQQKIIIHLYVVQLGTAAGVLQKQDENPGPHYNSHIKM